MNNNNNNNNNKHNISSITDPRMTKVLIEGFWNKTTTSSATKQKQQQYISGITDPIAAKLEIIKITTETTTITTKIKTTTKTYSTTENNKNTKSQLLMT